MIMNDTIPRLFDRNAMTASIRIAIPGDDPPQLQGSPHLDRLRARGEVALYTDRPDSALRC